MEAKGKRVEACRIICEKIRNTGVFDFLEVLGQSLPASGLNGIDFAQHAGFLLSRSIGINITTWIDGSTRSGQTPRSAVPASGENRGTDGR